MKPDLSKLNIPTLRLESAERVKTDSQDLSKEFLTAENIPFKPLYNSEDLKGLSHLDYGAGIPPFLRGYKAGPTLGGRASVGCSEVWTIGPECEEA